MSQLAENDLRHADLFFAADLESKTGKLGRVES
jgi:hypothetical protein